MDLLVEQSEESLRDMRDARKADLARITVEIEQIEEALTRKTRRKRTGGGKLTRDQVYEIVWLHAKPVTAAEAHALVTEQGIEATLNAVRNHLLRLVADERLKRLSGGRFAVPLVADDLDFSRVPESPPEDDDPEPSLASADDDIPF